MENIQLEKELSIIKNKLIGSSIVAIVLSIIGFVFIQPKLEMVSYLKTETVAAISDYDNYYNQGITDIGLIQSKIQDPALKKLLISPEGKEFFLAQFKNSGAQNYETFLDEKERHITAIKKSGVIDKRNEQIAKVIPSYTEWVSVEWNMTDLGFVNYVESLLRAFQLKTTSKIGIEWVIPVDNEDINIQTQIFYIPLKLDLIGRKADIVEFLYFLQNVGTVKSVDSENNNSLVFYKDNIVNKAIPGQTKTLNYNIYENKLVDIESIELTSYVDTSTIPRPATQLSPQWFVTFLKNGSEKNDEYSVNVNLKFYVKGLPTYKIEVFVESVVQKYTDTLSEVKNLLSQAQNRKTMLLNGNIVEVIPTIKSIELYLGELQSPINKLKDGVGKKVNLNVLYKEAIQIDYELWNLQQYVKSIQLEQNKK